MKQLNNISESAKFMAVFKKVLTESAFDAIVKDNLIQKIEPLKAEVNQEIWSEKPESAEETSAKDDFIVTIDETPEETPVEEPKVSAFDFIMQKETPAEVEESEDNKIEEFLMNLSPEEKQQVLAKLSNLN